MIRRLLCIVASVFLSLAIPGAGFLPAVVLVVVAASKGPLEGVVAGSLMGLLLDLLTSTALGANLAVFAIVGFSTGRVARILPLWPAPIRVAACMPLLILVLPLLAVFEHLAG